MHTYSAADEAPPTIQEELCRKTVEMLERLVYRAESHRMSKDDLALVGTALWSITSGLVTDDVSDLCAAVADAGKEKPMRRHFVGKGFVRTVAWRPDSPGYAMVNRDPQTGKLKSGSGLVRATDIGLREAELENLFASLRKAGYVELEPQGHT